MRKRKNLAPRMLRAQDWLVDNPEEYAGRWQSDAVPGFRSAETGETSLLVELGCGMGRFACETAKARTDTLVIGMERIPDALIIGMERAMLDGIPNARFILGDVNNLTKFFAPGEINELYIQFCDPWPHRKHAPRRLAARNFLRLYRPLLAQDGFLRFKTDNVPLFEFAQKEFAAEGWTVTHCDPDSPPETIMTEYERKFRERGTAIAALTATP